MDEDKSKEYSNKEQGLIFMLVKLSLYESFNYIKYFRLVNITFPKNRKTVSVCHKSF